MSSENQKEDDLWEPCVTRYCDEDGNEYARGTPQGLANQVRELKAIVARSVPFLIGSCSTQSWDLLKLVANFDEVARKYVERHARK